MIHEDSYSRLRTLDQVCIEFEDAMVDGRTPRISDYVEKCPDEDQDSVLAELLWIEWELKRRGNQAVTLDEYLSEFSTQSDIVLEAWRIDQNRADDATESSHSRSERYRIVRAHARGGLGQVYKAVDQEVGRSVALKEVHEKLKADTTAHERLLREAQITGRLQHPGVVPVFSIGSREDGNPFYTMRFVEGDSLLDSIQSFHGTRSSAVRGLATKADTSIASELTPSHGSDSINADVKNKRLENTDFQSLEFRRLLTRFSYACQVLHYAHLQGVLHRDFKPSNIMLGRHGETVVVDWGLAKEFGPNSVDETEGPLVRNESEQNANYHTTDGTRLGTRGYSSPEQFSGELASLGPASDIYSAGATLFHLLSGRAPKVPISDAADLGLNAPAPLVAICRKAVSTEPGQRYQTAAQFSDDIENWLADKKVEAYAEPTIARAFRWSRNHLPVVASMFVAALLLTVASVAVALVANARSKELQLAKEDAEEKTLIAQRESDAENAISSFMQRIFDSASPDFGNSRITVAELLVEKFHELQRNDALSKESKLRLLTAIGRSLVKIDQNDQALEVLNYVEHNFALADIPARDAFDFKRIMIACLIRVRQMEDAQERERQLTSELQRSLPESAELLIELNLEIGHDTIKFARRDEEGEEYLDRAERLLRQHDIPESSELWTSLLRRKVILLQKMKREAEVIDLLEPCLSTQTAPSTPLVYELAAAYSDRGRHQEAIRLLNDRYEAGKESELPLVNLNVLDRLSYAYSLVPDVERAIEVSQEALSLSLSNFGRLNRNTVHSRNVLARRHLDGNDVTRALELLKESLSDAELFLPKTSSAYLATLRELGRVMAGEAADAEGIEYLESGLAISDAEFGVDSRDSNDFAHILASSLRRIGRAEEALPFYQRVLEYGRENWGPDSRELKIAKTNYASALTVTGRSEEAAQVMEELIEDRLASQASWASTDWGMFQSYLAVLTYSEQLAKVVKTFERLETGPEQVLGWDSLSTCSIYVSVSRAMIATGEADKGRALYDQILANLHREAGKAHVSTLYVRYSSYDISADTKDVDSSLGNMENVLLEIEDEYGVGFSLARTLRRSFTNSIHDVRRYDLATKHFTHELKLAQAVGKSESEIASLEFDAGLSYSMCEEYSEAIPHFRRCVEQRVKEIPNQRRTATAKCYLANALDKVGQTEEASQLFEAAIPTIEKTDSEEFAAAAYWIRASMNAAKKFYSEHDLENSVALLGTVNAILAKLDKLGL